MGKLKAKIESVLFVAARPMALGKLADACGVDKADVKSAVDELASAYNTADSGIRIMRQGDKVQMGTSPDTARTVKAFLKDEATGELTKPSLEALTIIAYRGPVTKPELEQIRGVNCSIILRNLMMRGLVEASGEHGLPNTEYSVTMDFLRFLGVSDVEKLPDYDSLSSHENLVRILEMAEADKKGEDVRKPAVAGTGDDTE